MRSRSHTSSAGRRARGTSAEITPQGRLAGLTTGGCLVVAAAAVAAASVDELTCRGSSACAREAGIGGLAWLGSILGLGLGVSAIVSILRRPVDRDGLSGWTWGLAVLFTAGAWLVVTRIPSLTCPAGYHLDAGFRLCIRGADRFEAASWVWLKSLLWAASAVLAIAVVRRPRAMPWSAVLAAAAWFTGTAWILHDTLLKTVR